MITIKSFIISFSKNPKQTKENKPFSCVGAQNFFHGVMVVTSLFFFLISSSNFFWGTTGFVFCVPYYSFLSFLLCPSFLSAFLFAFSHNSFLSAFLSCLLSLSCLISFPIPLLPATFKSPINFLYNRNRKAHTLDLGNATEETGNKNARVTHYWSII